MARKYIIRSGCSFRLDDGSLATGGEVIELEDDVATAHADKVEPVPVEPALDGTAPADQAPEA
jgi:hypothetical protein